MRYIPCTIETLHTGMEDYWHITVPAKHCAEAALAFCAMHLGRGEKIVFSDQGERFLIRPNSITLGQRTIPVDRTWLEVIWCLFLDTHQNGWTNTAHVDQDFSDKNGRLCITISIAPSFE